jgi:hypothetical protein
MGGTMMGLAANVDPTSAHFFSTFQNTGGPAVMKPETFRWRRQAWHAPCFVQAAAARPERLA